MESSRASSSLSTSAVTVAALPTRWLALVLTNLLCASDVTDGDIERFRDFLTKHLSEEGVESSACSLLTAGGLVASGVSTGGRNALVSSARLLLCLVEGTCHGSLARDNLVAMTDEDNAAVLSLDNFHESASLCYNKHMTPSYQREISVSSRLIADKLWCCMAPFFPPHSVAVYSLSSINSCAASLSFLSLLSTEFVPKSVHVNKQVDAQPDGCHNMRSSRVIKYCILGHSTFYVNCITCSERFLSTLCS